MNSILLTIFSSLAISAVSFAGSLALLGEHFFKKFYAATLVSFAAGVMLSAALLDLLPEAVELNPEESVFVPVLLGMVGFFFLERFVLWFHHHHESHGAQPASVLVIIGDGFHNFIDGLALAAAFSTSIGVGLTTTLAIAAHEIPQEIADFSVLKTNGMSTNKALLWNFLSGLPSILGAVCGIFFIQFFEQYVWVLLSASAGMFLYIASSDLIPELHRDFHRDSRWQQTLPFIFGIVTLVVVRYFTGA